MVHQGLLEWIGRQPDWVKDALRRHALLPNYELDEDGKREVNRRVKSECGISQGEECPNTPITAEHLDPREAGTTGTLFVALGPLENVGRLAKGQRLSFALDGITLIYGDNGTGKSGFCRVAKKLCRSLTTNELIGDIGTAGEKPPATANVDHKHRDDAEVKSVTWTDGERPPPEIASISVFDSQNARLYIDSENKIGFLPREVALLEQHAKHRAEMDRGFDAEIKALGIRMRTPLPGGYEPTGQIAKLLQGLTPKAVLPTKEELTAAAQWSEADQQKLTALTQDLAKDPKALADAKARMASALRNQEGKLTAIEKAFSEKAIYDAGALANKATQAAETAGLAADTRFSREKLPGVGHEPWRRMFQHAEAYIKAIGLGDHVPHAVGEPCALCQQPLFEEAAARMSSFHEFLIDSATTEAEAAQSAYVAYCQSFGDTEIEAPVQLLAPLTELKDSGEAGAAIFREVGQWTLAMRRRKQTTIAATETRNFTEVSSLPASGCAAMIAMAVALEAESAELAKLAAGDAAAITAKKNELSGLKDKQKLSEDLPTVLERLTDLEQVASLTKCREAVATTQTSNQITTLRKALVSEALEGRIKAELKTLDLLHLPFRVTDRSERGTSNFKVTIDTPISAANDQILSEGEQRALALACFLGELGGDDQKNGIIVDDPVSSLDHIRIRKVAARLVEEAAAGRQVVLFTHNLIFYNEVANAAAAHSPPIPLAKRIVRREEEAGFGVISNDDEPWIAQNVNERIARLRDRLKEIGNRKDAGADGYRRAIKDYYSDLRETWERLVEELLLGKVVERFNTDVRTQSLKSVYVDDEDYATVFWAMKAVSERSGHDTAAGKQIGDPSTADMKADLDKLDEFRLKIAKRRKEVEASRKAREEAPAATTA